MQKTECWGAGVVICMELGADLHSAQLMPLPLTVSCFSKIQTGFNFLVPAHLGSPGKRAIKQVYVLLMDCKQKAISRWGLKRLEEVTLEEVTRDKVNNLQVTVIGVQLKIF